MKRLSYIVSIAALITGCTTNPAPVPDPEPAPPVAMEIIPTPKPPPPPPLPDPADLLGLTPLDTQRLLGEPSLVRWEGAAQMRQFKNEMCVFDLYYQEDGPGQAFRIIHMDARTPSGVPADKQNCLIALLPGGDWPGGAAPKASQ